MTVYHLTAEKGQEFIEQLQKLVGDGTFTYISPDEGIFTVCRFDWLHVKEDGGIYLYIQSGDKLQQLVIKPDMLSDHPHNPTNIGFRVHAHFMANVLRLLIYAADGSLSEAHAFVANHEP